MARGPSIKNHNMQSICDKYGFDHELKNGDHFVTIDGNEVEVKFREDGSIYPGRNAFMTEARKASKRFMRDYPTKKGPSRNGGEEKPEGQTLNEVSLGRCSVEDLESAKQLIDGLIRKKRELEELEEKIKETERRLSVLDGLDAAIGEFGGEGEEESDEDLGRDFAEEIANRAAKIRGEVSAKLAELRRKMEEIEKQPVSGYGKPSDSQGPNQAGDSDPGDDGSQTVSRDRESD